MRRLKRGTLRRQQRVAHQALYSSDYYDSVQTFAWIASFTRAGHDFVIALPAPIVLSDRPVSEETPLSLLTTNRQGHPAEVARFRLERDHRRVVLDWTIAVRDTDFDYEANQHTLEAAVTAVCLVLFAGHPLDPALGIRFKPDLALTARDQHGNLFALNFGGSHD